MRRWTAFLLAFTVLTSFCANAAGLDAKYPDLPPEHWAYAAMDEARDLGYLTGLPDGRMLPDGALSWGAWLTLLGRAFYPQTLAAQPVDETQHWASNAYLAARAAGVLQEPDFLPVSARNLDGAVSRQDTAVLLDRVLRQVCGASPAQVGGEDMAMADWNVLPEPYRASVLQCYARGLVTGYEDGRFGGGDGLSRASGAVLLLRTLDWAERAGLSTAAPPPVEKPAESPPPAAAAPEPAPPAVSGGEDDPLLRTLGDNAAKRIRLYGTADQSRYSSEAEALAAMTEVTVPVWKLDRETGVKTPGVCTFTVNAAVAADMTAIFTEIFNDPEQFPIHEIGGYDWRGDSATGEHNCGTAVDLNANENYQLYADGRVGAGGHWTPGEDPWSIPEDGSVVRIFNAYGWSWGGNAWPTNKDYMHFSYFGV